MKILQVSQNVVKMHIVEMIWVGNIFVIVHLAISMMEQLTVKVCKINNACDLSRQEVSPEWTND